MIGLLFSFVKLVARFFLRFIYHSILKRIARFVLWLLQRLLR